MQKNCFIVKCGHNSFPKFTIAKNFPKSALSWSYDISLLAAMHDLTDITDWTFYEGTGQWTDFKTPLTQQERDRLFSSSPIAHVHKIRTPYLLLIGEKDLRVVPHFRGFVRTLQARGVNVKVLSYPESNHPLIEVDVEADFAVNMLAWFEQHAATQ